MVKTPHTEVEAEGGYYQGLKRFRKMWEATHRHMASHSALGSKEGRQTGRLRRVCGMQVVDQTQQLCVQHPYRPNMSGPEEGLTSWHVKEWILGWGTEKMLEESWPYLCVAVGEDRKA